MVVGFFFQLLSLVQTCAPDVAPETMLAIVEVSSQGDPLSISVVGARVKTPPTTVEEAVTLATQLEELKKTFFLGVAQLPQKNLSKLGLTYEQAFDPCTNLTAASKILVDCYLRAKKRSAFVEDAQALSDALSCYRFGNFTKGYQRSASEPSYVEQVRAVVRPLPSYVVPALPLPFSVEALSAPLTPFVPPTVPVAPVLKPFLPEAPLLVPSSRCEGVVLGSPCSSSPSSLPLNPSPDPSGSPSSPGERKESSSRPVL